MLNRSDSSRRLTVSAVALLAVTLAPAHAQEAQQQDQQAQQSQQQTQQTQQQAQQGTGDQQTTGGQQGAESDALIATVGQEDVRASDVMAVIEMMPPRVRQQPQQMLVPMAIEQVVLRELILQQAMSENLGEDPEVVALVEDQAQIAEDDAMVGVWLQRQMESRVTDQAVQEVYDRLQSEAEEELPPLETLRPQIEQQLGRQAIEGIRSELGDNISVVYYGPDGQPIETTAEAEPGTAPEGQEGTSDSAGQGTGTDGDQTGTGGTATGSDGDQSGSEGGASD